MYVTGESDEHENNGEKTRGKGVHDGGNHRKLESTREIWNGIPRLGKNDEGSGGPDPTKILVNNFWKVREMTTIDGKLQTNSSHYDRVQRFPETIGFYYFPHEHMVRSVGHAIAKHLETAVPVTDIVAKYQPMIMLNGKLTRLYWDY